MDFYGITHKKGLSDTIKKYAFIFPWFIHGASHSERRITFGLNTDAFNSDYARWNYIFLIIEQHSTSCWIYTNTARSEDLWLLAPSTYKMVKTRSMSIYDVELKQHFSGPLTLLTVVLFPGCLATERLRFEVVWEICGSLHSHRSQARSLWFKELAVLVMTSVYGSYSHLRSSSK